MAVIKRRTCTKSHQNSFKQEADGRTDGRDYIHTARRSDKDQLYLLYRVCSIAEIRILVQLRNKLRHTYEKTLFLVNFDVSYFDHKNTLMLTAVFILLCFVIFIADL